MTIRTRITATSTLLVALTAAVVVTTVQLSRAQLGTQIGGELDHMTRNQVSAIAQDVYNMCNAQQDLLQKSLRGNLNVARDVLRRAGEVSVSTKDAVDWTAVDQTTQAATPLSLPRFTVGGVWTGQVREPATPVVVVDEVKSLVGGVATIFQRMNDGGDMLRVATNVPDKAGKRAIGTFIPRRNADGSENAVLKTVLAGEIYVGRAFVVDTWYVTAYEPIRDKAGALVGMLFVGVKQDELTAGLRQAILDTKVGDTGYVFILGGTGQQRGRYIISRGGSRDGEEIWGATDSEGRPFIQSMVQKAVATKNGTVEIERYPWQNAGEATPRMKISAVTYFAPWDWVIGAGAYEEEFRDAAAGVDAGLRRLTLVTAAAAIAIAAVAAVISLLVARGIANPIRRVTHDVGEMARGDFSVAQTTSGPEHSGPGRNGAHRDEVSTMLEGLRAMAASQVSRSEAARAIASGDLTVDIELSSERDTLGRALQDMSSGLNRLLSQVDATVKQVAAGSDQVAQSSQALSQGATEQASTLEEISSALAQISGQAKHNAESADEANNVAQAAAQAATQGNGQMKKLAEAMGRIHAAAQEITKVVKLIDDIAFQINLLALNANVEAARAGKYGKGFAVVADEVRNLAVRSAGAVKDTTEMVRQATVSIGEGSQAVQTTAAHLEEIVQRSTKVADFLGEIALASKEQAQGVAQINTGVEQIDQVTQANTANSEQSAAAAEELSSQARELEGLLARFKLKQDDGEVMLAVTAPGSGGRHVRVPREN